MERERESESGWREGERESGWREGEREREREERLSRKRVEPIVEPMYYTTKQMRNGAPLLSTCSLRTPAESGERDKRLGERSQE
jgi:hypothetical protein